MSKRDRERVKVRECVRERERLGEKKGKVKFYQKLNLHHVVGCGSKNVKTNILLLFVIFMHFLHRVFQLSVMKGFKMYL